MAALSSVAHFRVIEAQQISAIRMPSQRKNLDIRDDAFGREFSTRARISLYVSEVGSSQKHGLPLVSRRSTKSTFATRKAANKHQNHVSLPSILRFSS